MGYQTCAHTLTKTAKRPLAGTQCPSAHFIAQVQDLNLVLRPPYLLA